ncbi:hypothetical protein BDQ12DRAFT_726752 [Crucibulum laeve]|uniref:F-box domain-containing protein n=1 Tax=Crucibulum laeve TaxID=68775 RepID=A0A5C3LMX7_9AGAR|nr:hypothetical protein BDQ12DRAFT_726752 [Crucibulum laeve]
MHVCPLNSNIPSFVQALGPSLHHLEIASQFHDMDSNDAFATLDLSSATSLKHFCAGSSTRVLSLIPWVLRIISQLPESSPPTLKILQIAFASSRQFFLDLPFLRCLSSILARPGFSKLEIIHFVAFSNVPDEETKHEVISTISTTLEEWNSKGVLRFTFPN